MKGMIAETELARLEELAGKASTLPFEDMAADGWGYVVVDILPAVTTAVPALIAEIRRLRRNYECSEKSLQRHEHMVAELMEKVEAWEWFGECFDNCKQRGKLPLEVHKTPSAYSEAWASLWAAREAVHADRE